jgi:hypothetical protein
MFRVPVLQDKWQGCKHLQESRSETCNVNNTWKNLEHAENVH